MSVPEILLTDCLTNCCESCVEAFPLSLVSRSDKKGIIYGRGILNGMLTAVMVCKDLEFDDAVRYVKEHAPKGIGFHGKFVEDCVPPVWREVWERV